MSKHIALFGGSFDPPHLGHQALVQAALSHLNIDELWIIPVGKPVHRQLSEKANAEQRILWLSQMFEGEHRVKIKDWEVQNEKPTPAIDTLRHFQHTFPDSIPTWLMGEDSFSGLPDWVGYPKHLQLCNLVIFKRIGYKSRLITGAWNHLSLDTWQQQRPEQAGHAVMLDVELPNISSTLIRENAKQYNNQLPQSTCNAILACYASDSMKQKREDT